jgi:hypothetical protein
MLTDKTFTTQDISALRTQIPSDDEIMKNVKDKISMQTLVQDEQYRAELELVMKESTKAEYNQGYNAQETQEYNDEYESNLRLAIANSQETTNKEVQLQLKVDQSKKTPQNLKQTEVKVGRKEEENKDPLKTKKQETKKESKVMPETKKNGGESSGKSLINLQNLEPKTFEQTSIKNKINLDHEWIKVLNVAAKSELEEFNQNIPKNLQDKDEQTQVEKIKKQLIEENFDYFSQKTPRR